MAKKNDQVRVTPARETGRVVRRVFPGPDTGGTPLRVNFDRQAYADLTAHAKESVDAEVGGVLVGEICEDGDGVFVDVRAVIRALAAREARAHITFTHETWTKIHETLDRDHRGLQIVGWYHTHPGFGVEFSAMDRFIQENFFAGRAQIAFLTDPLGGDTAVCFNGAEGIESLPKFWVDGREHKARLAGSHSAATAAVESGGAPDVRREIERLEARINQLIQAVDEQRANFYRMLTTVVVFICAGIVVWVAYAIYSDRTDRMEPPRVQQFIPVPVKVGNETVMLGVGVVEWKVPPGLDALLDKVAKAEAERRAEERKELQEQQKKK
ncbi:MAG TPA: Mov34/MPN/PAD-1 family protein [Thermoanaerobaculia bacterium]|nr:Mov34/MPN/PAD-1 family protein [Thermoanaerobaculia bacterium]